MHGRLPERLSFTRTEGVLTSGCVSYVYVSVTVIYVVKGHFECIGFTYNFYL